MWSGFFGYISWERRTMSRTLRLYAVLSFLHITAASILAGDESFGSVSIDMTDIMICSTPSIGRQRSSASSIGLWGSTPGGCKMEMHTLPSGNTFGCHISVRKVMVGGMFGKSGGKSNLALNIPPSSMVSGGPTNNISHWNRLEPSPNPTETPSGGLDDNSAFL